MRSITVGGDVGSSIATGGGLIIALGEFGAQDSGIERLFDRYHIYLFKPAALQVLVGIVRRDLRSVCVLSVACETLACTFGAC